MADASGPTDEDVIDTSAASPIDSCIESKFDAANNDGNQQELADALGADTRYGDASHKEREACRNFLNNRCQFGNSCKYRHVAPEQRSRSRSPIKGRDDNVVCRDYVQNRCSRGDKCKFNHPPKENQEEEKGRKRDPWFTFCLDYQKGKCNRSECRFFHVRREDEEHFCQTGEISYNVIEQALRKSLPLDIVIRGIPACKDYQKSSCRLHNCRFRHMNRREYEDEVYFALQKEFKSLLGEPNISNRSQTLMGDSPMSCRDDYVNPTRDQFSRMHSSDSYSPVSFNGPPHHRVMHPDDVDHLRKDFLLLQRSYQDLKKAKEDEVASLRREVAHTSHNRNGGVSSSTLDSLQASNEGFIKDNRQLLDSFHRLTKENDELRRSSMQGWSGDLQAKLSASEMEVKSLKENLLATNNQLTKLEEDSKRSSGDQINQIQEMVNRSFEELTQMEEELRNWGSSVPPTFRDGLHHLKMSFNQISNFKRNEPQPSYSSGSNLASEMKLKMAFHY